MTKKAFVIGHPIAHSRSPLIHGYWFDRHDIDGVYERIDVDPDHVKTFVSALRDGTYVGGNVTVPHKQAVLPFCDRTDDTARLIQAVNTLVVKDHQISGTNTDWYGFLANLDDKAPGWDEKKGAGIVLGAGGAARAVLLALSRRGFSPLLILNRTKERAKALAADLAPNLVAELEGHALDHFSKCAPEARLVVNTSTIGMNATRFENLPLACLPGDALVADIVYTPLETPLLADAAARGLETVDGLGMLLHQAVPAFEAWFGVRPEVTRELRSLIEHDMGLA